MLYFLLILLFCSVHAYLEETYEIDFIPENIGISNECTLFQTLNGTILRFHDGINKTTDTYSDVFAVNNNCDLVVFGFPENNSVILWRPFKDTITIIEPEKNSIQVDASRFGFSVDVQNQTWVVGAPGLPNNSSGQGATQGYAFVYEGDVLHSCRSLYDTFGFPNGASIVRATYKNTKDHYRFLKADHPRYYGVFANNDTTTQIKDSSMIEFQKRCITRQNPYYDFGPLDPNRIPYFVFQQFGYAVGISGGLYDTGSSLFISAPGDTNRFMEDNDGSNYGRVYVWDNYVYNQPNDERLPPIPFWEMTLRPFEPPNLRTATYRAYGRDIAVSNGMFSVSTYPLYENTREPFVIIYDCLSGPLEPSNCVESPDRGISIDDIPINALNYLTNDQLTYTDGKTGLSYIPAGSPGQPDFQNKFIGKKIGIAGSNVIIPDPHNKYSYRFGRNSKLREKHHFDNDKALSAVNFGTNTEHWTLRSQNKMSHLWPCERGTLSPGRSKCTWEDKECHNRKCIPCEIQYYSNDGWLQYCNPCRRNYTTYEEGKTKCKPFVPPPIPTISWTETVTIILIICAGAITLYLVVVAWQCYCVPKRKRRKFNDKINV